MESPAPPLDALTVRASNLLLALDGFDPDAAPCGVCGQPKDGHDGCPDYQVDPAYALALAAFEADERTAMADIAEYSNRLRAKRKIGWRVGPSAYGKCRKAIQYDERPPVGYVPLPEDTRKADVGTAVHLGNAEAQRALYPWRRFGMWVKVRGLDGWAEIDRYDPVTATIDDWKTAGRWAWDMVGRDGAFEEAVGQVELYGLAVDDMGLPINRLRIRYINRETGEEETFSWLYDRANALRRLEWLMQVLTALDVGAELPRDRSGPSNDPICQRCPAREHCWNMAAAAAVERSPESYTELGAEPDDPTIAWAAERLHKANEAYRQVEEERENAKALVDGLRVGAVPGTELEVYRGYAGHGTEWKAAYLQAAELWRLSEANRPAELPPPGKRRPTRYTQVRKVRAAKTTPQTRIKTKKKESSDGQE